MGSPPVHGAMVDAPALVRGDHLHAGGLADDAAIGPYAGQGQVVQQRRDAQATHFIVETQGHMDRRTQRGLCECCRLRQHHADEAFHVAGATAEEAAVANVGLERIGAPGLPVDRHHIGMPRKDHTTGSFAERGEQVGLGALGVVAAPDARAVARQVGLGPVDQREVGIAAGGVEGDQLLQAVDRVGVGGVVLHACVLAGWSAYSADRPHRASTSIALDW